MAQATRSRPESPLVPYPYYSYDEIWDALPFIGERTEFGFTAASIGPNSRVAVVSNTTGNKKLAVLIHAAPSTDIGSAFVMYFGKSTEDFSGYASLAALGVPLFAWRLDNGPFKIVLPPRVGLVAHKGTNSGTTDTFMAYSMYY